MCMQLVQKPELYDVLVLPQPLRRHPLRPRRRPGRRPGRRAGRQHRRAGRALRADPRQRAQVRRHEQGEPDRPDAVGRADAPAPQGERGRRPDGGRHRRRHPRGQRRHLRHEAPPRRPDRRRDVRGRRRHHREAEGALRVVVSALSAARRIGRRRRAPCGSPSPAPRGRSATPSSPASPPGRRSARTSRSSCSSLRSPPRGPERPARGGHGARRLRLPAAADMVLTDDPRVAFADADWCILVGTKPRGPGMERADLLKDNGKIFVEQGSAIDEVASDECRVVVVGNPCNTNCMIAAAQAAGSAPERFTAMTRLDQNRARTQLAQKAGVSDHRGRGHHHLRQPLPDDVRRLHQRPDRRPPGARRDRRRRLARGRVPGDRRQARRGHHRRPRACPRRPRRPTRRSTTCAR